MFNEVKNIEEHDIKLTSRQLGVYASGLIFGAFMAAGVYFGIKEAITDLGIKITQISVENVNIRQDIKNMNTRMDQVQNQAEVRYLELKLDLEKKQDKRK